MCCEAARRNSGLLHRGKWGLPLPRKHTIVTFVGKPIPGARARLPGFRGMQLPDHDMQRVQPVWTTWRALSV